MALRRRTQALILCGLAAIPALYFFRIQIVLLLRLLIGGLTVAYLLCPISRWLACRFRLSRSWSIIGAFFSVLLILSLIVVLFLPPLIRQMKELITALPALTDAARLRVREFNRLFEEKGLGRLSLPEFNWEQALSSIPPLLGGTASLAGSLISRLTEWTLILILGYYFLRDRERLALHLELLVPSAFRRTAVRMASSVHHEIGIFLRGQLLISAVVAVLSALALMIVGVRPFLALGLITGIFNMIPYFGPILGAIPAVLTALMQSPFTALLAAAALLAVQQLDSLMISPRIMGSLTGLHPAVVLLSITLGGSLMGLIGMLLAIPFALAVRAVSRVWVARSAFS